MKTLANQEQPSVLSPADSTEAKLDQIMQSIVGINQRLQDLSTQISAQQIRTSTIERFMFSDYNTRLAAAISISNDCMRLGGIGFCVGQTLRNFLVKLSAKYKADRGSFFMEFELLTCFINGLEDKDIRDPKYHGGRLRLIIFLYIVNFEKGQDYTNAAHDLVRIYEECFPGHSMKNYDLNWFPVHHRKTLDRIFKKALSELAEHNRAIEHEGQSVFTTTSPSKKLCAASELAEHNGAVELEGLSVFTTKPPSKKLSTGQEGKLEGVQIKK